MLLEKNAFLRANVSEILELDQLKTRVEKFRQINDEYLKNLPPTSHSEEQKREADLLLNHQIEETIEDVESSSVPFD